MRYPALLVLALPLLLSGCFAAVVGAGAETGESVAEERTVGTKVDDSVIYADVTRRLINSGHDLFVNVNVRVRAQRVMLTGTVANEELARQAVAAAWQAKGVKEVINELLITSDTGFFSTANDALIQKNLESRLLLTKGVWVINYSINVVNGNAYLLGRTYTQAEMERVLNVARTTKGVKKVVNHLQVKAGTPGVEDAPTSTTSSANPNIDTAPAPISSTPAPAPVDDGINHYAPGTSGTISTDSVSTSPQAPAGGY